MERSLLRTAERMNQHEVLTGRPLDDAFRGHGHYRGATKDMRYSEVREEIMSFIERLRDTFRGARPMDIDNNGPEYGDHYVLHFVWGGGGRSTRGWTILYGNMRKRTGWRRAVLISFRCNPSGERDFKGNGGKGNGFWRSGWSETGGKQGWPARTGAFDGGRIRG